MSSTRWCGATVPGEAYPHSPPERAQEQCQTHHHGSTELCKGIYPRPARGDVVFVSCSGTRGVWNLVQLKRYIMGKRSRVWIKPHTIGFHLPLCGLLQHTNQSILLFLTHHHLRDPFFVTSQRSAACEGRGGSNGVNDLVTSGDAEGLLKARRESRDQRKHRQLDWKSWSLTTQA